MKNETYSIFEITKKVLDSPVLSAQSDVCKLIYVFFIYWSYQINLYSRLNLTGTTWQNSIIKLKKSCQLLSPFGHLGCMIKQCWYMLHQIFLALFIVILWQFLVSEKISTVNIGFPKAHKFNHFFIDNFVLKILYSKNKHFLPKMYVYI